MQRSRYTHIAKQVFPYSQESTTGSLQYSYHNRSPYSSQVYNLYLPLVENHTYIFIIEQPFTILITSVQSLPTIGREPYIYMDLVL